MLFDTLNGAAALSPQRLRYIFIKAKWPLTARFLYTVLLRAAKGHFCEFLISNIVGSLSFCGMDAACQRNANLNTHDGCYADSPSGIGLSVSRSLNILTSASFPSLSGHIRSQRGGSDVHWYHPFCDLKISNFLGIFKSNAAWINSSRFVRLHEKCEQISEYIDKNHKSKYNIFVVCAPQSYLRSFSCDFEQIMI